MMDPEQNDNPFASPLAAEPLLVGGAADLTEAERIRFEHLKQETSIRSFGILGLVE
jgi:hypothetical protein